MTGAWLGEGRPANDWRSRSVHNRVAFQKVMQSVSLGRREQTVGRNREYEIHEDGNTVKT